MIAHLRPTPMLLGESSHQGVLGACGDFISEVTQVTLVQMSPTIKITEEQKRLLDSLKIHPRQTYCQVLDYLLEPLTIPSFTPKESKKFMQKIEQLRSVVRKRMEKQKGGEKE